MSHETVIDVLMATTSEHPKRPALRHKRPDGWKTLTWTDYQALVLRAGSLLSGYSKVQVRLSG